MNPLPMVLADLWSLRWLAWAVPLIVALAVAIGIGVNGQEHMLRVGSAPPVRRTISTCSSGRRAARRSLC